MKEPLFISTVEAPLIRVGTIMGQDLYVKLDGHDAVERDHNFMQIKKVLQDQFGMPPEVPPLEPISPVEKETVETDTFGDHTVKVYDDAPDKADYRIELLYKGEKVREMIYPAYRIYTFLAHWKENDLPTEKVT